MQVLKHKKQQQTMTTLIKQLWISVSEQNSNSLRIYLIILEKWSQFETEPNIQSVNMKP